MLVVYSRGKNYCTIRTINKPLFFSVCKWYEKNKSEQIFKSKKIKCGEQKRSISLIAIKSLAATKRPTYLNKTNKMTAKWKIIIFYSRTCMCVCVWLFYLFCEMQTFAINFPNITIYIHLLHLK